MRGLARALSGSARAELLMPAVAAVAAIAILRLGGLDKQLADALYALEGGRWVLRGYWLTADVLHIWGQRFMITVGVFTLAAVCAGYAGVPRLRRVRAGLAYVLGAALSGLLLVSLSKHTIPIPCPWDLARYGGDVAGGGFLGLAPGNGHGGCFPAGHAAGGYSLIAWYFFARHYRLPGGAWWLAPALVIGVVFGVTQQLRGAHFLSHDLASATVCWLTAAGLYHLTLGRQLRKSYAMTDKQRKLNASPASS